MTGSQADDWNVFWRKRNITSFGDLFPHNYDGPIRDFWAEQLSAPVETVVDVACGNGALTWLADGIIDRASETKIIGVDFADIDPFVALGRSRHDHPRVSFIGNTAAEKLPFADRSIDLVISQYGIEYSDLDASIPEIGRVLTSSGTMAFILHDQNSTVVREATRHLGEFRAVLDLGIHDHALRLLELGASLPTKELRRGSRELAETVARLEELTGQVRAIVRDFREQSAIHRYMNGLMRVVAQNPGEPDPDAAARITAEADRLRAQIARMEHLQSAALSRDKRDHLIGLIERAGFSVTRAETLSYRHEANIGLAIVARRSLPG